MICATPGCSVDTMPAHFTLVNGAPYCALCRHAQTERDLASKSVNIPTHLSTHPTLPSPISQVKRRGTKRRAGATAGDLI